MSTENSPAKIVNKVVVVFDICSSTRILEDLLQTENHEKWKNLLIGLKKFLIDRANDEKDFIIYKFLGDGYILLFDWDYPADDILTLLSDLCVWFDDRYSRTVRRFLDSTPNVEGMTFGIDRGKLVRITMQNKPEYVGRAINVAARLQGSVEIKNRNPSSKALLSRHYYSSVKASLSGYKVFSAKRKLRNVGNGGVINCNKVLLKSD